MDIFFTLRKYRATKEKRTLIFHVIFSKRKTFLECGKVKHEQRVTSSDILVTSSSPQVTSSNSRVTSSNPRVRSSNTRVTSSNSRVTSLNPRVTSSNL